MFIIILWRFLLCLYIPLLYMGDTFENLCGDANQYADKLGWSYERTKVRLLQLWYKY